MNLVFFTKLGPILVKQYRSYSPLGIAHDVQPRLMPQSRSRPRPWPWPGPQSRSRPRHQTRTAHRSRPRPRGDKIENVNICLMYFSSLWCVEYTVIPSPYSDNSTLTLFENLEYLIGAGLMLTTPKNFWWNSISFLWFSNHLSENIKTTSNMKMNPKMKTTSKLKINYK